MNNQEIKAIQLGFESIEEMEKYYELVWPEFKGKKLPTKKECENAIVWYEMPNLLNQPREERLRSIADFYFGVMTMAIIDGNDEKEVEEYRKIVDSYLEELKKCANKDVKKDI